MRPGRLAAERRPWVLLGLLLAPPAAGSLRAPEPPEIRVEAPPEAAAAAARAHALDRRALLPVLELLGVEDPGPPIRVVLAPEGSDLARAAPRWVAGYAYGALGTVVLFPGRTPPYPESSFEELLHHEIAHVLIVRAAGYREVPRWFHEGLAMVAGRAWGLGDRARVTLALLPPRDLTLAEVDTWFGAGEGRAARAYALSGAFVRDLLHRHGEDVAARLLARVAAGVPFAAAFGEATGQTLAAAEAAFWRRQDLWSRWVPLVTSSATLWIGVTLLALYAIRRRRQRDAALFARWQAEEAVRATAPQGAGDDGETVH
jgi:hypothetical protein